MALRDIHEYAEELDRNFRFDHCSAFIRASAFGMNPLVGITETESSRAINAKYMASGIYAFDPFMTDDRDADLARGEDVFAIMTPESDLCGRPDRRFWSFMTENGMGEVGASTRRIAPGINVVIGLHRRGNPEDAVNRVALREALSDFHDLIARHLLSRTLGTSAGFGALTSFAMMPPAPAGKKLSVREERVAELVKDGKRNKEIAFLLDISENTVEGHLRNMFRKLNVHNRTSLISILGRYR